MAIKIDRKLTPQKLVPKLERFFDLSGQKILSIEKNRRAAKGTPVFTVNGQYTTRGWTEWTQGFQFGSAVLQYDATGDERFLKIGHKGTVKHMASHVSHTGVHDHGFNNISTYGNLRRLMREGKIAHGPREMEFYELALKVSGAVQAARWTDIPGGGYIYSFNGPHSLFIDTIRSLRSLAVAHQLGHALMGERDRKISLLERLVLSDNDLDNLAASIIAERLIAPKLAWLDLARNRIGPVGEEYLRGSSRLENVFLIH